MSDPAAGRIDPLKLSPNNGKFEMETSPLMLSHKLRLASAGEAFTPDRAIDGATIQELDRKMK